MVVANSDYGEERNNKKRNDNHDICEFDKLEIISEDLSKRYSSSKCTFINDS